MPPASPRPAALDPAPALVRSPYQVGMPGHGVVVRESRHAAGFYGDLKDDYAKFHLVIAGRARWEGAGRTFEVGPGTLFFVSAGTPHRQRDRPDAPVTLYFIHFRPELVPPGTYAALAAHSMLPIDLVAAAAHVNQRTRAIFQEMLFEQEAAQSGFEAVLLARLLELVVMSLRLAARAERPEAAVLPGVAGDSAMRVAAYARRQESAFYLRESIDEAATSVHLSRRRFTDLFRAVTGETWLQRLQRLRLGHACRLLRATERSVTAIAFECGFDDLSHFHHSFKRSCGCTPVAYREQDRPIRQP